MVQRNGIIPSSIPFEQRYRPPDPKKKKREHLTVVDRLVCAICGGFLGFVIWTFGYIILLSYLLKASAKVSAAVSGQLDPLDRIPSFWWVGFVSSGFAIFGALVGAERMLDTFEIVIKVEKKVADAVDRSY